MDGFEVLFFGYLIIFWVVVNKVLGWLASSKWYFPHKQSTNFQNISHFVTITFISAIIAFGLAVFNY